MLKLTLSAALILSATAAQAGYYDYLKRPGPTPEQQMQIMQQQLYEQQLEIYQMQKRQSRCVNRAAEDGRIFTYCPD